MKPYDIYFEIFGKKMKTTLEANSEEDAKYRLMGKIIFHKVVVKHNPFGGDETLEHLKDLFGMK